MSDSISREFERVRKKQKLGTSGNIDRIRGMIGKLEKFNQSLQEIKNSEGVNTSQLCEELDLLVKQGAPDEADQKEIQNSLTKLGKAIDKGTRADIDVAFNPDVFDDQKLEEVISHHLTRQGQFELVNIFNKERGQLVNLASQIVIFEELCSINTAFDKHDYAPLLSYCKRKDDKDSTSKTRDLHFNAHKLNFICQIRSPVTSITSPSTTTPTSPPTKVSLIQYLQTHLSPFASTHMSDIEKLSCAILWFDPRNPTLLSRSPYYTNTFSDNCVNRIRESIRNTFRCHVFESLGLPPRSPLELCVEAGTVTLPKLLKLVTIMQKPPSSWTSSSNLIIGSDLPRELTFHSVFVCPVSHEQSTVENPPVLLRCGHMICRLSLIKLTRGGRFKCPYCPVEQTLAQVMDIVL